MIYVDASYETHTDMKGHTGGLMSLGHGVIHTKSSKQKLNTKSSTESELVGASDYIPWAVWTAKVLEHQGYKVKRNIFYQDNESAIIMEKNGRKSAGDISTSDIFSSKAFVRDKILKSNIVGQSEW